MGLEFSRPKPPASDILSEHVYLSKRTLYRCLAIDSTGAISVLDCSYKNVLSILGGVEFLECKLFKVKSAGDEFALIRPHSSRYVAMYFCYNIDLDANQYGKAWVGKEVTGTFFLMTVTINEKTLTKMYSHLTATDLSMSGVKEMMHQSSKDGMGVSTGTENSGVTLLSSLVAENDDDDDIESDYDAVYDDSFADFISV